MAENKKVPLSEYAKAKQQEKKIREKLKMEKEKLEKRIGKHVMKELDWIDSIEAFEQYFEKANYAYEKLIEVENQKNQNIEMAENVNLENQNYEVTESVNYENRDITNFENREITNN